MKPGPLQKAKAEYVSSMEYALCEFCNTRAVCRYCHKDMTKNEKHVMCDLGGDHYHEKCLRSGKSGAGPQ